MIESQNKKIFKYKNAGIVKYKNKEIINYTNNKTIKYKKSKTCKTIISKTLLSVVLLASLAGASSATHVFADTDTSTTDTSTVDTSSSSAESDVNGQTDFSFVSAFLSSAVGQGSSFVPSDTSDPDQAKNAALFKTNLSAYLADAGDSSQARTNPSSVTSRAGSLIGNISSVTATKNSQTKGKIVTNSTAGAEKGDSVVVYDKSFLDDLDAKSGTSAFNNYYSIGQFKDKITSGQELTKGDIDKLEKWNSNDSSLLGAYSDVYNTVVGKIVDFFMLIDIFAWLAKQTAFAGLQTIGYVISAFALLGGITLAYMRQRNLRGSGKVFGKFIIRVLLIFGSVGLASSLVYSMGDNIKSVLQVDATKQSESDYIASHVLSFKRYVTESRFNTADIDKNNPTSEQAILKMNQMAWHETDSKQLAADILNDAKNNVSDSSTFTASTIASRFSVSLKDSNSGTSWSRKIFDLDPADTDDFFITNKVTIDGDDPLSITTRSGLVGSTGSDALGSVSNTVSDKGLSPLATYNILSSKFNSDNVEVSNTTANDDLQYAPYYNYADMSVVGMGKIISLFFGLFLIAVTFIGGWFFVQHIAEALAALFKGVLSSILGGIQFISEIVVSFVGFFAIALMGVISANVGAVLYGTLKDILGWFKSDAEQSSGGGLGKRIVSGIYNVILLGPIKWFLETVIFPLIIIALTVVMFIILKKVITTQLEKMTARLLSLGERMSGGIYDNTGSTVVGSLAGAAATSGVSDAAGNVASKAGAGVKQGGKLAAMAVGGVAGAALSRAGNAIDAKVANDNEEKTNQENKANIPNNVGRPTASIPAAGKVDNNDKLKNSALDDMSDEERAKFDSLSPEEQEEFLNGEDAVQASDGSEMAEVNPETEASNNIIDGDNNEIEPVENANDDIDTPEVATDDAIVNDEFDGNTLSSDADNSNLTNDIERGSLNDNVITPLSDQPVGADNNAIVSDNLTNDVENGNPNDNVENTLSDQPVGTVDNAIDSDNSNDVENSNPNDNVDNTFSDQQVGAVDNAIGSDNPNDVETGNPNDNVDNTLSDQPVGAVDNAIGNDNPNDVENGNPNDNVENTLSEQSVGAFDNVIGSDNPNDVENGNPNDDKTDSNGNTINALNQPGSQKVENSNQENGGKTDIAGNTINQNDKDKNPSTARLKDAQESLNKAKQDLKKPISDELSKVQQQPNVGVKDKVVSDATDNKPKTAAERVKSIKDKVGSVATSEPVKKVGRGTLKVASATGSVVKNGIKDSTSDLTGKNFKNNTSNRLAALRSRQAYKDLTDGDPSNDRQALNKLGYGEKSNTSTYDAAFAEAQAYNQQVDSTNSQTVTGDSPKTSLDKTSKKSGKNLQKNRIKEAEENQYFE
ncbi:hypothetical protein [Pseudolactococcus insecticola]|uniref:Uncharacterized protein n=1 Tax=Pseudolactococcus insecticola TaxID=2709158 RepID=A0A6A0B9Z1_9LACT|nr:hypothetical protein [Lactococcus insecticola]GFH41271.1 hypothetical protein Hs20B_16690 [Lactococcus insecticola]